MLAQGGLDLNSGRVVPPSATSLQVAQKCREVLIEHDRAPTPLPRNEFARRDRRVDGRTAQAGDLADIWNSIGTGGQVLALRLLSAVCCGLRVRRCLSGVARCHCLPSGLRAA
jgi:hypothetical protein